MTIDDKIQQLLSEAFLGDEFEVINESFKHLGHAGDNGTGQTHYNVVVQSKKFAGLSRVQQQRLVTDSLKSIIGDGQLHALRIKTIAI